MAESGTPDETTALLGRQSSASPGVSDVAENLRKLDTLAAAQYKAGKYLEAQSLLRNALATRVETLGETHPDTLLTMDNLASALGRMNLFTEAEELFRLSLTGRESSLGPKHVDTLTSANHYAVLLKQMGKLEESAILFERASEGLNEIFPADNITTAEVSYNYGVLCVQLGRRKKAIGLFHRAHRGLAASLGANHPHALDALYWELKCTRDCESSSAAVHSEGDVEDGSERLFQSHKLWQSLPNCQLCNFAFNMLRREHHCRICCRSVCHDCARGNTLVPEYDKEKAVRICAVCEQQGF